MSRHMLKRIACASVGLMLAACSDNELPTTPTTDDVVASAASLDAEAGRATSSGDTESATAFRSAAAALRYGVRPSQIAVSVRGETHRYLAVVTAVVEVLADQDTALRRTLVAWEGDQRPVAVLQVATLGDQGSFSSEAEPATNPRARAHGLWVDLVRNSRWLATTGDAGIRVASHGGACLGADVRCVRADFRVDVDGLFRLNGASPDDGEPAVRIQVETQLVKGVILARSTAERGNR